METAENQPVERPPLLTADLVERITRSALVASFAGDTFADASRTDTFLKELDRQRRVHRTVNVLTSLFNTGTGEVGLGIFVRPEAPPAKFSDDTEPQIRAGRKGGRAAPVTHESDINP